MGIAANMFVAGVTMLFLDVIVRGFFTESFQKTIVWNFYTSLVLMTGAVVIAVIAHGFARREAERRAEQLCCHSCEINLVKGVHRCPSCGVNVIGDFALNNTTQAYDRKRDRTRVQLHIGIDRANRLTRELLEQNGFIEDDMLGEKCFKRGSGILQPVWYIKTAYAEKEAYIYAWSRQHFVPGMFGGESNREWGGKNKKALKQLEDMLSQTGQDG